MMVAVLPILTMVIGFLCGIVTMDVYSDDKRVTRLEREVQRLKKKMEVME